MTLYYDGFSHDLTTDELIDAIKQVITEDDITEEMDELYTVDDYIMEYFTELGEKLRDEITEYCEAEARLSKRDADYARRCNEWA